MQRKSKTLLGGFLRARRMSLGMNQQAVADQVGVSKTCISKMEVGRRDLSRTKNLPRIAEVLHVDPALLSSLRATKKVKWSCRRPKIRSWSLAFFLSQSRKSLELTQLELEKTSGIPLSTLSRLENGHTLKISAVNAQKLAAALGRDIPEEFVLRYPRAA